VDAPADKGALVLVFGSGDSDTPLVDLTWKLVPVDEASAGYFMRAPSLRDPAAKRLPYFAPFLEHADRLIAEDAYLELGHAAYDEVAQASAGIEQAKLRRWIADPGVLPEHKGLYGMLLGFARTAEDRRANTELLERLVLTPEDDFRAGFDGMLGGYLLLKGQDGLKLIEERLLANPRAAHGDVRHAMTALRFYQEYGREIPSSRLAEAAARLLERPEFAAAVIVDLGRWRYWPSLDRIAALYEQEPYAERATRRAIVGYLLACPLPAAREHLRRLRSSDPQGVADAEQAITVFGGASR
jgi:hypothetical protein